MVNGTYSATYDAIDVDISPFKMSVGLARLTDRQCAGAQQLALEDAINPDAVVDLHDALKDRAATDDRVQGLAAGDSAVVLLAQHVLVPVAVSARKRASKGRLMLELSI